MSEGFLSQEEIDALLKGGTPQDETPSSEVFPEEETAGVSVPEAESCPGAENEELSQDEMDVIGEVGNISMGSAATTLSDLVRNRVSITTPQISMSTQQELFGSFTKPYVVINISYTKGLSGSNLLLISAQDAVIIADLMMGGDGENVSPEFGDLQLSAVSEAMNQMMGSAATSMSNMFGFTVTISPPTSNKVDFDTQTDFISGLDQERIVVVAFHLVVGNLIDSQIMQVIPIDVAKELVKHLLSPEFLETNGDTGSFENGTSGKEECPPVQETEKDISLPAPEYSNELVPSQQTQPLPGIPQTRNLDLILDVPLKVSVVLGRCKRPIGEVLKLVPGTIVELDSLSSEPVDILVNGTLIAQGEVVVVNENFGIQVKNIISPEERLQRLKE